jgi:site-specific DNA-methyltransferase (adenine-specific)
MKLPINQIVTGDCLEVMKDWPDNSVDLVLTDPPYPDMTGRVSKYKQTSILFLNKYECKQFIFWHSNRKFPLDFTAIHIWDKKTGCQSEYERIFERNGQSGHWRVFNYYLINSIVAANYTGDVYTGHPSQKPIHLITKLIEENSKENDLIIDPFCGSGTTCVAAKKSGRRYIGIDISEEYCQIARERLRAVETGVPVKEARVGQLAMFG